MTIKIEHVQTQKQLEQFIRIPWQVYKQDPNWVPWLYFERLEFFDKTKNPFFEHAEADYFIAYHNGQPVGSIAALINHRHNEFHNENVAHFGVFEVQNNPNAAQALLDTACEWAAGRGVDKILGPMNLSTNDECGTLIEGFDMPPLILMTYNPRYYVEFIEAAGFTKAMDLWAWRLNVADVVDPEKRTAQAGRIAQKVKERYNLSIRPVNLKDWDNELNRIQDIYNNAWEKNWGFVPMTKAEIARLADSLKPIVNEKLAHICEQNGVPVGFSLILPNVNEPLGKARPGASVLGSYIGAVRMLLNKHKSDWIRVIALGVVQEFRTHGVDALLYYEGAIAAHRLGYKYAEGSWILETNDKMNRALALFGGQVYKKYRIYEKVLHKGKA